MSVRIILVFILFFFCKNLFAQVQWAHLIGAEKNDYLNEHAVDADGDIIAAGSFEGTVNVGDAQLTSTESSDIFVYKAAPNGRTIWAKVLSGPSYQGDVGVATDMYGNIYLAGGFVGELHLDGKIILKGNDRWNTFLTKFDAAGNLLWIKGIIGQSAISSSRVFGVLSANTAGEVVIAANIDGEVKLENHLLTSEMGDNLVIAKYTSDGNLVWYHQPESMANTEAKGVVLDEEGEVYLTGFNTGTISFGNDRLVSTSSAHGDIFVAKLSAAGQPLWIKGFNKPVSAEINNEGKALAVDPITKEIYLTGSFKGEVRFDGITLTGVNTSEDPGSADIFLAKLTADGAVVWAKRLGTSGHDFTFDLWLKEEEVIIAGAWSFSPFTQTFDKEGNKLDEFVLEVPGYATGITRLPNNEFYMSGIFFGFDQDQYLNWSAEGYDGFLVKIGDCQNSSVTPVKPVLSNTCTAIKVENYTGVGQIIWYMNDVELPESTANTTLQLQESGNYKVGFKTSCGITFSEPMSFNREQYLPEAPLVVQAACNKLTVQNAGNHTLVWLKNDQALPNERGADLTFTDGGKYTVQFLGDCGFSATTIEIRPPADLRQYNFYNVITPNGDGKNDYFVLDSAFPNSSLQVFNRWGKMVYESKAYKNDWNGEGLAAAEYFLVISNECVGSVKGMLTLIR